MPVATTTMPAQPPLSDEQELVVADVRAGRSVVCISKPGTGKTTTALACAEAVEGRTLLLTYNRKLKDETRARVAQRADLAERVEVHSYHAAACRFFVPEHADAVDDSLIHAALGVDLAAAAALAAEVGDPDACPAPPTFPNFRLLVVDEAQDMTPLYAAFVRHVLATLRACHGTTPQMLVVGDPFQRIFGYLGASWEYMMHPANHFEVAGDFVERQLTLCWRITPEMAAWVNANLDPASLEPSVPPEWWAEHGASLVRWWAGGIRSGKPASPGSVVVVPFESKKLHAALGQCLPRFEPGECAYLCKTVRRSNELLTNLIDTFAGSDWVVTNDASPWEATEATFRGKAVVTTIQRFKGLERPFVCVIGVDGRWEGMQRDPLELFTLFLVATTRASRQLVVVTGTPAYATLRKAPLPTATVQRPKKKFVPEATSLLLHTAFDPVLNVPAAATTDDGGGAVRARLVHALGAPVEGLEEARIVPGRTDALVEDASAFLDEAVVGAVAQHFGHPLRLRAQRLLRARLPAAVRAWIMAADRDAAWTLEDSLRVAIAARSAESNYGHQWRQVRCDHAPLLGALHGCVEAACALLTHLRDGNEAVATAATSSAKKLAPCEAWTVPIAHDWFCEVFDGAVEVREGRPHFAIGTDAVVTLVTAPVLRHDAVLHAALVGALRSLYARAPVRSYVVHTNGAALYEVESRLAPEALVEAVLRRRVAAASA